MSNIKIRIPKADEKEVATIAPGAFKNSVKKRFEKIDNILFGVITAVVVSLVAVVISTVGLFLDQMRYNNAAYKEYSQKIESVETTQKTNEVLLKQIQELIEQSKQDREIKKLLIK